MENSRGDTKEPRHCPFCGKPIELMSTKCHHCGAFLKKRKMRNVSKVKHDDSREESKNKIFRDFVKRYEKIEDMAEQKEVKGESLSSESESKIPSFECKNCISYWDVDEVLIGGDGSPRCPDCNYQVKPISEEDEKESHERIVE